MRPNQQFSSFQQDSFHAAILQPNYLRHLPLIMFDIALEMNHSFCIESSPHNPNKIDRAQLRDLSKIYPGWFISTFGSIRCMMQPLLNAGVSLILLPKKITSWVDVYYRVLYHKWNKFFFRFFARVVYADSDNTNTFRFICTSACIRAMYRDYPGFLFFDGGSPGTMGKEILAVYPVF